MVPMDRNDWLFFTACFGAFFTVGAVYVLWRYADSTASAGWAQAFGTIGALGVAIYFPRRDRAERKQRDLAKAYALLKSLTGSIFLLDIDLVRVQRVIDQQQAHAPDFANWEPWFRNGQVDIPKPLLDAMPLLRESDDPMVGRFCTVAMLAETFNAYMVKFSRLNPAQVQAGWQQLYPQITGQLALLRSSVRSITE